MSESKKFIGQPILSQIITCISKKTITDAVRKHNSNHYYKRLPTRVHLVSLLNGFLAIVMVSGKYVKEG